MYREVSNISSIYIIRSVSPAPPIVNIRARTGRLDIT